MLNQDKTIPQKIQREFTMYAVCSTVFLRTIYIHVAGPGPEMQQTFKQNYILDSFPQNSVPHTTGIEATKNTKFSTTGPQTLMIYGGETLSRMDIISYEDQLSLGNDRMAFSAIDFDLP